uniref:Secreted RxLR effector peptide protein n=1 Tax=Panagrellus redivivus TaxID=6233 RepID=A0A7E4ZU76_PANRE
MTSKFPFRHSIMSLSLILPLIFIATVNSEPEVSEIDNTAVLELPLSKIISTRRTRYVIDDIQTTVDTKIDDERK